MSIIPLPVRVEAGTDTYTLPDTVQVRADGPGAEAVCSYLVTYLQEQLHLDARATGDSRSACLTLQCGPSCAPQLAELPLPGEAYQLRVDETGVSIAAQEPVGLFYGVQSLIQLLPATPQDAVVLQHVQVLPGLCCFCAHTAAFSILRACS